MPNIFTSHDVTTGEGGRFVFERVFPGKGRIGRRILLMVNDGATEVTSSQRVSAEFTASVDRDGSFHIDDVPEGNYVLSVRFSKDPAGNLSGYRFSVLPDEEGTTSERIELGSLTLKSK